MTWFGLSLPVIQQVPAKTAPWEREAGGTEILAIARAAERLGYRYVTCSDHVLVAASYAASMGATGCPEVKWLAPVRPGDRLRVRMKVLATRASRSRPDLGFVDARFDMFNAQDVPVMMLTSHLILGRRTSATP